MVDKDKNDRGKRGREDYAQISGYVPKNLVIAFKIACAANEVTQSEALEQILSEWLKTQDIDPEQPLRKKRVKKPALKTIAQFIYEWEGGLATLSKRSGIKIASLEKYQNGERPTDSDLVRLGELFEDSTDGHLLSTEELLDIRSKTFDNKKRKETNGV